MIYNHGGVILFTFSILKYRTIFAVFVLLFQLIPHKTDFTSSRISVKIPQAFQTNFNVSYVEENKSALFDMPKGTFPIK